MILLFFRETFSMSFFNSTISCRTSSNFRCAISNCFLSCCIHVLSHHIFAKKIKNSNFITSITNSQIGSVGVMYINMSDIINHYIFQLRKFQPTLQINHLYQFPCCTESPLTFVKNQDNYSMTE